MTNTGKNHRPPFNVYVRRVLVSERLPRRMGYYKASFKRSTLLADQLFIPDDPVSEKLWKVQIEWWTEEIEEPFALTKSEALEKLRQDDEFVRMILKLYFDGKEDKYRVPNQAEINLFKTYLQNYK